jgi:hypothetical protein
MADIRSEQHWYVGQRIRMAVDESLAPRGTLGTVRRVYDGLDTLIVYFDGDRDVCLVGAEEVEVADENARSAGEPLQ